MCKITCNIAFVFWRIFAISSSIVSCGLIFFYNFSEIRSECPPRVFNSMKLIESLHSIFKPLSSRFERFFEVLPHTTLADDINKNAFLIDGHEYSDHWYEHNRAMLNALKADSQTNLLATLIKYCSDDHQFPPDVIKCQRLFLSLQAVQPTNILELGCGTSSMVISKYRSCSLPLVKP